MSSGLASPRCSGHALHYRGGEFGTFQQRGAFHLAGKIIRYFLLPNRLFDSAGNPLGPDFLVSDDTDSTRQDRPSICMSSTGTFLIAWQDYREDSLYDIFAQLYDSFGNAVGDNFKANDDAGSCRQWYCSTAMDGPGNCTVVWRDNRNVESDIYAQRYDLLGTMLDTNFKAIRHLYGLLSSVVSTNKDRR